MLGYFIFYKYKSKYGHFQHIFPKFSDGNPKKRKIVHPGPAEACRAQGLILFICVRDPLWFPQLLFFFINLQGAMIVSKKTECFLEYLQGLLNWCSATYLGDCPIWSHPTNSWVKNR